MNFNIHLTPGLTQFVGAGQAHKAHGLSSDRFAAASQANVAANKGALAYQFIPNNGLAGRFNRLA